MKHHASSPIAAAALLASLCAAALYGQSDGGASALCAGQSTGGLPANIRITSDQSDGISYVRFDAQGGAKTLTLRAVERVEAVCPLAGNKIIIFGALTSAVTAGYELAVASAEDGTMLDSWDAYTPAMSRDRAWLILRKFYPPQTALTVSEEYLLYPLWKIETEKHAPQNENAETPAAAIVAYPLGQTNSFMSNIGVSPDQVHVFRSKSFFWSEDSRAVLFADSVRGVLSAVLVEIDRESPTTLVYPLSVGEACEQGSRSDISTATLTEAYVSPDGRSGGREIQMKFEPDSPATCKPKMVVVHTSDFQKPKPEPHQVPNRKPSTPAGQ